MCVPHNTCIVHAHQERKRRVIEYMCVYGRECGNTAHVSSLMDSGASSDNNSQCRCGSCWRRDDDILILQTERSFDGSELMVQLRCNTRETRNGPYRWGRRADILQWGVFVPHSNASANTKCEAINTNTEQNSEQTSSAAALRISYNSQACNYSIFSAHIRIRMCRHPAHHHYLQQKPCDHSTSSIYAARAVHKRCAKLAMCNLPTRIYMLAYSYKRFMYSRIHQHTWRFA